MAFSNNRWVLAGITSNGIGCAEADYPGIYTRVSSLISFIDSNVNLSMSENTTILVTTSAMQLNSTTSSIKRNVIDKLILILILISY
jgi:secreted trypsin-like serine protease